MMFQKFERKLVQIFGQISSNFEIGRNILHFFNTSQFNGLKIGDKTNYNVVVRGYGQFNF